MESFDDIQKIGWSRVTDPKTHSKIYIRPNKTKVRQRRDLSDNEKVILGDILFPQQQSQPKNQSQAYAQPLSVTLASSSAFPDSESSPAQPESDGATSGSVSSSSRGAGSSRSSVFSLTPQETHTFQEGGENDIEIPEVKA